jgi:S-adenosylmethionine decarboxylase
MKDSVMGNHYVIDISEANSDTLNNKEYLIDLLEAAAVMAGCTVIETIAHQFSPQGVSVITMLAESHISIHTWPERGEAALDVFTCGEADCRYAGDFIIAGLSGRAHEKNYLERHRLHEVSNPSKVSITYNTV